MGCSVPRVFRQGGRDHPQGGCKPAVTADARPRNGVMTTPADQGVAVMKKPAAVLFVLSLAVLALALVPAAGLAAKGGGANTAGGKPGGGGGGGGKKPSPPSYTGTIGGPVMVADTDHDGTLSYGDSVTFNVTSSAPYPFVEASCKQGGDVVWTQRL